MTNTAMEKYSFPFVPHQGAVSFTKFGDLPPELRVKIWRFAIPEARVVVIKSPYVRREHIHTSLGEALSRSHDSEETWYSTTQIPALLHVNAEARHEALKIYSLSLGIGGGLPKVYVDFNRDTLFFGADELSPACSSLWARTDDLRKVRRLAVVPQGAWRALRWKKVDLNSLEKLVFVDNSEEVTPGYLPELVEDEQWEADWSLGLERQTRQSKTTMGRQREPNSRKKQRIQEARDEFATLKVVLLDDWEKEPRISTAVFRESKQASRLHRLAA